MESTAPAAQDKVLTGDGLTLKGVQRIERINCDATYKDVILRTWQCSRLLRRDFYLVTYKMFFVLRSRYHCTRIRDLLADLQEEANVLAHMARIYELPPSSQATAVSLRLVNDQAQILLESIIAADKAIAKLKTGTHEEVLEENITPYFVAFHRLKSFVLMQNGRKEAVKIP